MASGNPVLCPFWQAPTVLSAVVARPASGDQHSADSASCYGGRYPHEKFLAISGLPKLSLVEICAGKIKRVKRDRRPEGYCLCQSCAAHSSMTCLHFVWFLNKVGTRALA